MKRSDFIVVPAAAIAVMVLNVAISVAIVWVYSSFVDPGRPAAHYEAFAMRAAPVSSVIAGIPLMLAAGFLIARRRPGRAGLQVAAAAALLYILIDTGILLSVGAGLDVWIWAGLSHSTKLLSALAGAKLGMTRPASAAAG
jgi:hypothetical protein